MPGFISLALWLSDGEYSTPDPFTEYLSPLLPIWRFPEMTIVADIGFRIREDNDE